MSELVKVNGFDIEVLEYQDTWAVSNRQVAEGFGVTQKAVELQRQQGATEYVEGIHFIKKMIRNDGKGRFVVFDTPPPLEFRRVSANDLLD